jgi:DNA (cytosine-5)-methyltransferase 1
VRENQKRGFPLVQDWELIEDDVRNVDFGHLGDEIDLVAGGPPCQPFSMGGKHRAHEDDRDMFPAAVNVVRQLAPRAFIIENVKGLTRSGFKNYFRYIVLQFEFPEIGKKPDEDWMHHLARLEREKTSGMHDGLTYEVLWKVINAADYGVAQKRERVFFVGFRHDLGIRWSFPQETHSHDALVASQWVTGEYWDRHKVARNAIPIVPERLKRRVEYLRSRNNKPYGDLRPWTTVRDIMAGLPDPEKVSELETGFFNHRFQPGAKVYPGHTGSPLDLPAKTLKAGDHGVPGGENMLVKPDGSVRYFTVRESARLQGFPDGYVFHGSWTETMRQLGNAVPMNLAHLIGASVAEKLLEATQSDYVKANSVGGRT